MTFNGIELMAVAKMAIAMAQADGRVTKEETEIISVELIAFGLDIQAAKALLLKAASMDASEALACISHMNLEQKKYVTGFLAAIMGSDRDIDDSELKLWSLISILADLPTMTVAQALAFWGIH